METTLTPGQRTVDAGTLTIEIRREGATELLHLTGELDLATSAALDAELRRCDESDAARILLDLTELEFIESTGLRVLLDAAARSRANGNRLAMTPPPRQIERTLRLVGVIDRLPIAA
jgi:anti-anti-sigma factor